MKSREKRLDDLINPEHLYSREECLVRNGPIPTKSGVYAWWIKDGTIDVPLEKCEYRKGNHLLYVGIAPQQPSKTGRKSNQNLRTRIRKHYNKNAYGSTLRLSLGCLLGYPLEDVGNTKERLTFGKKEKCLSNWMSNNAFVSWVCLDEPWLVEDFLIERFSPPLNLKGNRNHCFFNKLTDIRKKARKKARGKKRLLQP
jgi:hypothetical protein